MLTGLGVGASELPVSRWALHHRTGLRWSTELSITFRDAWVCVSAITVSGDHATRNLRAERLCTSPAALDMPRSRYFAFPGRTDVDRGGALTIEPRPEPGAAPNDLDSARDIGESLAMAEPALADCQRQTKSPRAAAMASEPLKSWSENQFWSDFLDERDEFPTLKRIESQEAGHDIGYERATQLWLKHRPEWRAAHGIPTPMACWSCRWRAEYCKSLTTNRGFRFTWPRAVRRRPWKLPFSLPTLFCIAQASFGYILSAISLMERREKTRTRWRVEVGSAVRPPITTHRRSY